MMPESKTEFIETSSLDDQGKGELTLVSISVGVVLSLAGLSSPEAPKIGSLAVLAALGVRVALLAFLDEDFLSLGNGHSSKRNT